MDPTDTADSPAAAAATATVDETPAAADDVFGGVADILAGDEDDDNVTPAAATDDAGDGGADAVDAADDGAKADPDADGAGANPGETPDEEVSPAAEPAEAETAADDVTPAAPAQPAAAAPAAPAQPTAEERAAQEQTAAAATAAAAEYAKWQGEWETAKQKITTLDPIDDAEEYRRVMGVIVKGIDYANRGVQHVTAQQAQVQTQQQVAAFWGQFATENGVEAGAARAAWDAELRAVATQFQGASAETIQAVATERFTAKLPTLKASGKPAAAATPASPAKKPAVATTKPAAPATPAKPKGPPVTKGGGRVAPAAAVTRPPKPQQLTPEEQFDREYAKGASGFLND